MISVNVKWGKQKFENVELDTGAPVELFKAQLFALTQVPPERQKIMGVKGGALKDDADMSALGIKAGQNLMLMGSAEKVPEPPPVATVFAEDLPAQEVASMATDNPGGLSNLGNTCYLNSTLQCMKAIPELTGSLQKCAHEMSASAAYGCCSLRAHWATLSRRVAGCSADPRPRCLGLWRARAGTRAAVAATTRWWSRCARWSTSCCAPTPRARCGRSSL
jgi:hypothetical protein